jgi:hypothetical protein
MWREIEARSFESLKLPGTFFVHIPTDRARADSSRDAGHLTRAGGT